MDAATRKAVRARAANQCEYCGLRQDQSPLATLHVEHVIPRKHGGTDHHDNLALACIDCNLSKGTNIAGFDPQTGALTELFHPRRQIWSEQFEWQEFLIVGKTPIGRTTVKVLNLNSDERVEKRIVSRET
jgi:hypothetical protein